MLDCTQCNHHCQQCKSMCSGELVVFFSYELSLTYNFMQQQRTGYVFHRTLVSTGRGWSGDKITLEYHKICWIGTAHTTEHCWTRVSTKPTVCMQKYVKLHDRVCHSEPFIFSVEYRPLRMLPKHLKACISVCHVCAYIILSLLFVLL